jgi:hypothetical protein
MSVRVPAITPVLAACVMGILAAAAGAAAYAVLLTRASDFEFSVITVVIAFVVGRAIRLRAGHGASTADRVLAVGLTYIAIAAAYLAVRAVLLYSEHAFTLATLRPAHLLVLPIEMAARDWLLGVSYALALVVAWYACGGERPLKSTPSNDMHLA